MHGEYIKKASASTANATDYLSGRGDRIRTCGLLVPNQALYQTEPHPEDKAYFIIIADDCQGKIEKRCYEYD